MLITPDIYIEVRFKTTKEGGRKTSIVGDFYACPLFIDGEGFDCRLLIKGMKLELGSSYKVAVKFLNRDAVFSKLSIGKSVTLWEGKDVADGKVVNIIE